MFCEDYIQFENRIKENIEKINNENKINDIDLNECNKLIQEFKNILEKDKTAFAYHQIKIFNMKEELLGRNTSQRFSDTNCLRWLSRLAWYHLRNIPPSNFCEDQYSGRIGWYPLRYPYSSYTQQPPSDIPLTYPIL